MMTRGQDIIRVFFNAVERLATRFIARCWWLGLLALLVLAAYDVVMVVTLWVN